MSKISKVARLIDGKAVAQRLRDAIKQEVDTLKQEHGRPPALGLIMIGNRKDSAMYVKTKHNVCKKIGIQSKNIIFPVSVTEDVVLSEIDKLNIDPGIDGILVQLPLPNHIDSRNIIDRIHPDKDVDGLHPFNAGELAMTNRYPYLIPCTAKAVIGILDSQDVQLEGQTAVVIGRSNLVGHPVAMMLQKRNATVIQCHIKSRNIQQYVRQADVLVTACGSPYLIRGDWIKPGAVVIDVGINFVQDSAMQAYHGNENSEGYKVVGDVNLPEAQHVAHTITPVPGGVGPMTIAMLMQNVVLAFKRNVQS